MLWLVFIMCSLFDFSFAVYPFWISERDGVKWHKKCEKCNEWGMCELEYMDDYTNNTDGTLKYPCECYKNGLGMAMRIGKFCDQLPVCRRGPDCYGDSCVDGLCNCPEGWKGDYCNYEDEELCPSNQCYGHGKCKNEWVSKGYKRYRHGYWRTTYGKLYYKNEHPCECDDGYVGDNCEHKITSSCVNHGYLNPGCVCLSGYSGSNCEKCQKCNYKGTCDTSVLGNVRDNIDGTCSCDDGYEGPSCACKVGQCGVGGKCQTDGSCKCDPGYIGSDCSGHGTCDSSGCTCDYGFNGTSCNICEGCQSYDGEHFFKKGIYLKEEDHVVRLEEKKTIHNYREYNKAPWQAVKIPDANTIDKCYDACVSHAKHLTPRQSVLHGRKVTRWADRLDWGDNSLLLTEYNKWHKEGFTERTCTSNTYGISKTNTERDYVKVNTDVYPYTLSNPYEFLRDYALGISEYSRYYNNNYQDGVHNLGLRLMRDDGSKYCDDFEMTYEFRYYSGWRSFYYDECGWFSQTKDERLCVSTANVPPAPDYDYIMRNFWDTYDVDDVSHFELMADGCMCYTGKEHYIGHTEWITTDAHTSEWDEEWGAHNPRWGTVGSTTGIRAEYLSVPTPSHFVHRNADYVIPCGEGEYSVDTHCCIYGREPSSPGKLDCDQNIACRGEPHTVCGLDVNDNPIQCFDKDNATDFTGPIPETEYVCQCALRVTGNDCQFTCCERGDTVSDVFPAATVHGECNYGVGGCTCDYGYYGHECQCTDSMCGYGFCNRDLEEEVSVTPGNMCICHPGYQHDGDGKCTININDCASSPCQNNAECVDLANAYHCECPLGYVGDNCENATGWDQDSTSCGVNQYLVSGRCIDCPFGTYSLEGSTTCRVELTDDNIHNAVEEAMSDDPHYIAPRTRICTKGSMNSLSANTVLDCFEACPDDTESIIVTGLCYCVIEEADIASDGCQQAISSPDNGYTDHNGVYYGIWYQSDPNTVITSVSIYTKTFYNFYGDITTFDTSKVTNMDNLFLNKAVPDISGWKLDSVTSMRNMFAGSTGVFDRSTWDLSGKDATNIYAGSDLELQFVERTSGSCLDNQESEVRPVMSSLECLYAQYDATTTFSSTVVVTNLLPSAGRAGCRYPVAANSHEFTFRPLNINDLEECTSEVPCLCAKIRPGEYVKADACEGVYEPITNIKECTIAVRHLGEFYGVKDLTDGHCVHNQPVCKMRSYSPCDGTTDCTHNGLLCKSGVIIDDTCKVDNKALRDMVQLWNLYPDASLWLYGPLKDWDVHYVTDTTDLFKNMQNDPDITLWDMSNVIHADGMFAGSSFNHPIDNKDFSSLQTAKGMLPVGYGHRACGKHFVRAGKGESTEGFEGHGSCLRSELVDGKSTIQKAVDDWFDGDRDAVVANYGHMSEWDVSEVETMQGLFKDRTSIPSLVKWDVSKVANMMSMFENSDFNEDIRHWDVRKVTDFSSMFKGNTQFAVDLTFWEVHASTHKDMFYGNPYYDGITFLIDETIPEVLTDITFRKALDYELKGYYEIDAVCFKGGDNPVNVNTADDCFQQCDNTLTFIVTGLCYCVSHELDITSSECQQANDSVYKSLTINGETFTVMTRQTPTDSDTSPTRIYTKKIPNYGDISDWLTYQVTDMSGAFKDKQFNGDISRWVVSSVTDMSSMFEGSAFNSDISGWEVVNVKNMNSMFKDSPFNQMIDRWNVSNVADMAHMFENTVFSRPIGDWDLFGTEPNEIQAANDLENDWCLVSTGLTVNVDEYNRASLAARRKCFDVCTDLYPVSLPDIEGRNRNRGGGRVGKHYTPYIGGFGMVTNELYNHTCMCADETVECDSGVTSPFDYVYDYRDMDTTDMFKGNTKFVQPLCGLGWRYRDITSLGLIQQQQTFYQQQVSLTCDICTPGQHMMECGLCLGEFRFDRCMDSPLGFTINELEELGLTVEEDGETKVNPFACNCEYEDGMKGCLVVNGRRQVRMEEWYLDGETDFTDYITDETQYFCEVNFLDERPVANAEGFNSVTCTEDTLLDRFECGLVGGNWDGSCDKCLEPCDPPELGTKFISVDRTCTECPEGKTVFQNECVQCPDGKFTSEDHAYCGKCPQGTYGVDGECRTCEDGTASTFEGAIQCQMCGNNTYSVGTACLACAVNEVSLPGSNFCEEARYCWHGDTSDGNEVGNYCKEDTCHSNFTYSVNTCVSTCKYGDVEKVANEYRCECHGKWQGTACDECQPEFDFTYISSEMCVERACSDTLVTDCYCLGKGIVTGNEFCYDGKIEQKCSAGGSECMCDMSDGYEWAPEGTTCMGGKIVKDCDLFDDTSVPFEPCSNAGYTCKYGLRVNVCTDAFQCEARHFVPGADCCFGGYCSHIGCDVTEYNKGGLYVNVDEPRSECCLDRELCSDSDYSCGIRIGYKLRNREGSLQAPTVFSDLGDFDDVCCEKVPYKLHPFSKCANYFAERELTEEECDEYRGIYDPNQGYSAPVFFRGQCIMERTLGGIKSTTIVCIQEV